MAQKSIFNSLLEDRAAIGEAALRKDEAEAEARQQPLLFNSRDTVLSCLAQLRGGVVDPSKMVR